MRSLETPKLAKAIRDEEARISRNALRAEAHYMMHRNIRRSFIPLYAAMTILTASATNLTIQDFRYGRELRKEGIDTNPLTEVSRGNSISERIRYYKAQMKELLN